MTTAELHTGQNSVLINAAASGKDFGLGVDTGEQSISGLAGTAVSFSGWIKTANLSG